MDPSLKLFGKTIQLPGNRVTATAVAVDPGKKASAPPSETQERSCSATASSEDKCEEKPDKILECPRCNSMDTKFCYFNNYNVNQPRYFCKNCQRYWTSGGTMRNVPVGAGRRRKIKNFTSPHHHRTVKILAEKTAANCSQNGLHNHKPEELGVPVSPAAPYWGCYHLPLVTPTVAFQNPTNLGKHSMDDNKCLWFPKTLRIDELAVAAKSSIWATLGIMQNDRVESNGGGAFKAFKKCHVSKILTMNFPQSS